MPIAPNLIERTLFLTLNQGPGPMLDMWSGPAFWTVQAALKLNVFETLATGSKSAEQVATTIEANTKGVIILLNTLKTLGYVKQKGDTFSNSAMTKKWLLDSGEVNLTQYYLFWGTLMEHFMPRLSESIVSGEDMDLYGWIENQPEVSRYFQEGMIQLARLVGNEITKRLSLPSNAKKLLDIGGGHGEYAMILCRHNPQLSAVIFDQAQALVTGQAAITQAGFDDRISTQAGNFMTDELPQGFDVALVFNIVHGLQPEQNIALFRKIKATLNPGGQIVILEQVHNIAPLPLTNTVSHVLSLAFYHLIGGQVYTVDEIQGWLKQAGFSQLQRKPIMKAASILLMGNNL